MSDELNKEMDELEEVEEATAEPTGVKAKEPGASSPKSVKLKQEKENMENLKLLANHLNLNQLKV